MDQILQGLAGFLNSIGAFLVGPLAPLLALLGNTPLNLTTDNDLVVTAWKVMLGVADGFLLLFVLGGGMQMMIGQATGTLYTPPREFLPRLFAVALAMHASYIWLRTLLIFDNELCGIVHASVHDFLLQFNGGQPLTNAQQLVLAAGLGAFFSLTILRYVFQSIERIVLLNLLFVLGPVGMLLFFLPHTAAYGTYWHRMFIVTCFLQFVQFLAFGLGFAFLAGSGMLSGPTGIILGTGLMLLVTQIPRLFYRLSITAGGQGGGLGGAVSTALIAARLFA